MKKATVPLILSVLLAAQPAFAERNPADPYEPYNRAVSKFNDTADRYIMAPVARGYRKITPQPVRTGVSNFFNNLRDVVSFGSNLLRLDIKRASEDIVRVGINTTFGIGGLIDIAGAGGVPDNKNTLGDTLASWGWKNSNYFVVPLLGPSTVRDTVGNAVTTVYPVKNTFLKTSAERWGSTGLNAVNTRENLLDLTDSLDGAAIDKYSYTRDLYMRLRTQQTGGTLPEQADDNIDIDELVSDETVGVSEQPDNSITADTVAETAALPDTSEETASEAVAEHSEP
ncbi:VacJ family lipoprotein [Neisseria sp. ZJ106]|uniref:VacJ family lipoprotein n=1 Tax=Neisseria lisongii TaxID=2912188 RepID=A0ABY7RI61_9NEIS|nr:VacJ family lipoprotein [Neisseria lisongii]MCF7521009.1 VacJ family lipoprotein [Neisseria lisongii]WCL71191.1 VacJ family lipoprotein [Neisseria lisongii]